MHNYTTSGTNVTIFVSDLTCLFSMGFSVHSKFYRNNNNKSEKYNNDEGDDDDNDYNIFKKIILTEMNLNLLLFHKCHFVVYPKTD